MCGGGFCDPNNPSCDSENPNCDLYKRLTEEEEIDKAYDAYKEK